MTILVLRTDKPEAEIGLYRDQEQLAYETWTAHRQLAETLHHKLDQLLKSQSKAWEDIEGIVVYQGPGSFTGLRIGISVANALATSLDAKVVGATGDDWQLEGIKIIQQGENSEVVLPHYGSDPHITQQKK